MNLKSEIKQMPTYKKIISVGALLFLVVCLFPPMQLLYKGVVTGNKFSFIFFLYNSNYNSSREVLWSVLSVELIAIVVLTTVFAFVFKK